MPDIERDADAERLENLRESWRTFALPLRGVDDGKEIEYPERFLLRLIDARDAALREALDRIEDMEADAANNAGLQQSMKSSIDQICVAIGVERGHDHWPEFMERVKTRVKEFASVAQHGRGGELKPRMSVGSNPTAGTNDPAAEPDGWRRPKAGFDVGYGSLKEGDDCILVADGNMPSGPAKLLTVFQDGDAQIELRKVLTVKWRFLRPRPLPSPPAASQEGEG